MAYNPRPMTPHIMVYRWIDRLDATMVWSTLHRMTGICLCGGTILLTFWLTCAAWNDAAFAFAQAVVGHWIGIAAMMFFTWCLFYHLFHGVRHLIWDMGYGFEQPWLLIVGWFNYAASGGLTVLVWLIGFWWWW